MRSYPTRRSSDLTVILTSDPQFKTMKEEIFGPVITLYVYKDDELDEAMDLCDSTSPYALNEDIFVRDRHIFIKMSYMFLQSAGNFYIYEYPSRALVNQQHIGGS